MATPTDVIVVGDVDDRILSNIEQLKKLGITDQLANIAQKNHVHPSDIYFTWDSEDGFKLKIITAQVLKEYFSDAEANRTEAEQLIEGTIFGGLV